LIVHGLDDVLARRQALCHVLAAHTLAHRVEERAHHRQLDVRFQQRRTDLGEGLFEIGVTEASARAQGRAEPFESAAQ
jgi:hypothetical protein